MKRYPELYFTLQSTILAEIRNIFYKTKNKA